RAKINMGGPENWPEKEGIKTDTSMGQAPPVQKEVPLSPEETFLRPEDRHQQEDTAPSSASGKDERPFPAHEVPSVSDAPGGTFPKNEVPPAVSDAPGGALPKNEVPPAVSDAPGGALPKNEVPPAVSDAPGGALPKNEVPPAVSDAPGGTFPKNEVPPAVSDAPGGRLPNNEVHGGTIHGSDNQEQNDPAEQARKVESSVRGKARDVQEGIIEAKPEEEKPKGEERPVIYVDEKGNPVEKPVDINGLFKEVQGLMEEKKYDEALLLFERLKEMPGLTSEQIETVLYGISDCYWFRYEKDILAGYDQILSSTNEALNNNLRSDRVPEALLRLCLANVALGNILDAEGYMTAILRRYPTFPGAAAGLSSLAKACLERKEYEKAEKYFSIVLDKYPESSQLKDSSVGLIEVFYREKKFDRARLILDFVNKRWPRHYVDHPSFLLIQAALEKEFGKTDKQVQTLWQLYNIQPSNEQTVPSFLEMADIYLSVGNIQSASFLYQEILRLAPDRNEAITAELRLAEKGFYNSPLSQRTMFELFARGGKPPVPEVYQRIAAKSRTNQDSVLARLKLALWFLWNKQYPEAMGKAADFIDEYPEQPDKKIAEDIIWEAFQNELTMALTEQNYTRILTLWNGFPLVRKRYGPVDAKLRFALAQGQRERGDEEGCLNLLRPFLSSPMDPEYGEFAFLQFFNIYLSQGNWNAILDLGKTVESWKMKPELRQDLDYAMALSAQNLNLEGTALNIWKKIAANPASQLYQKAWATVFLAADAEKRKDIRAAYDANTKIVAMFTQLAEERSDKADPERIKNAILSLMDICEVANHIPEAIQWVNSYRPYAPENSEEYAALRYRESRLYRKLGDINRSQALLEEIVRHYGQSPYAQAARSELKTFEISRDLQSFQPRPGEEKP
ncbi:MAG: tetratricopeptide repeat protein, partial [Desulfovibrio sp.]|nr:tetratricopeptide repeat protein [Desulfovibrio sp.]